VDAEHLVENRIARVVHDAHATCGCAQAIVTFPVRRARRAEW
jgi:hypothetical protein